MYKTNTKDEEKRLRLILYPNRTIIKHTSAKKYKQKIRISKISHKITKK